MIVKTFIGKNTEEIEERIYENYGPEAIILTSVQVSPTQVEVSFGIEEDDFISYQKGERFVNENTLISSLDDDDDEDDFWGNDTIPDIGYEQESDSPHQFTHVDGIMSVCSGSFTPEDRSDNILQNFLFSKGMDPEIYSSIAQEISGKMEQEYYLSEQEVAPPYLEHLVKPIGNLINTLPVDEDLSNQKLIVVTSYKGLDSFTYVQMLAHYLQSNGECVRVVCLTDRITKSHEYDIASSMNELSSYISNYAPKCDHLIIYGHDVMNVRKDLPSAHLLYVASALWKPEDIEESISSLDSSENTSILLTDLDVTSTPASILTMKQKNLPPLSLMNIQSSNIIPCDGETIAKMILSGPQCIENWSVHVQENIY